MARIGIDEKKTDSLLDDLRKILDFVSKLKRAQISDFKEKAADNEFSNTIRKDDMPHKSGEYSGQLLKQAPALEKGYVKVKKVL